MKQSDYSYNKVPATTHLISVGWMAGIIISIYIYGFVKQKRSFNFRNFFSLFISGIIIFSFFVPCGKILAQTQVYNTAGTSAFTVPAGVTSLSVETWGGGGGGKNTAAAAQAGGGGGAYAGSTLTVTPGSVITLTVGAGGVAGSSGGFSSFGSTPDVKAFGGGSGTGNVGAAGGSGASSTGTIKFSGGSGGNGGTGLAGSQGGGGGGGSATATAPGGDGGNFSGDNGGAIGTGQGSGGVGGNGVIAPTIGGPGLAPGGGGGGNGKSGSSPGAGATGQVIVSWTCPTYSITGTSASSPICAGSISTVTLTNSTPANLPVGSYTVTYNLSAPNASTGNTATMNIVTAGTGTFTTSALPNNGSTTITITNLASGSCSNAISTNNSAVITVNPAATANAGSPQTVCAGGTITLAGSIGGGASSATWSAPSGTFSNPNSLTSTYTPSISSGSVTLTLTTNDPAGPCNAVSATVVITVNQAATANAGSPRAVCAGGTVTLAGSIGGSASSQTWTAPSGTFSNPNSLTSTYTPSIASGTVTLTLTTNDPDGAGPCSAAVSTILITVNPLATANAGTPQTVCSGSSITLAGSIGGSATGATWTAPGGTFSNPNSLTSTYTPSIASGTVTLTLTTAGPCTAVISTVVITVIASPIATVSASSLLVCVGESFDLFSSSDMGFTQPTLLYQDFNGGSNNWTTSDNNTGGTVANSRWTLRPDNYSTDGLNFHSNDQTQFYLSDSRSQGSATSRTQTYLTSPVMSTVGYTSLEMDFYHYFRFANVSNESAKVEVSTNGTTWTTIVTYTSTQGTSSAFANPVINLTAYIGNPTFYVRFQLRSNARARYWAIDNVTISGVPAVVPVINWTSVPAGFTSTVANPTNVTQTVSTTYVVTYTNSITHCSGSASVTVGKLIDTEPPVFFNVPPDVSISCQMCIQAFVNADFENNPTVACWAYIPNGGVPGWQSTTGTIEIEKSGCVDGVASYSGNYHAELNSDQVGDLYQSFCTVPTTTVQVSFAHHKRMMPTRSTDDIMGVWSGPNLTSLTQIGTFTATQTSGWRVHTISLDIPVGQTTTIFLFRAIQGAGPNPPLNTYGNLIDNIQAITLVAPTIIPYATDNCPNVSVTLVEQKIIGVCAGNYQLIRTWTAIDGSGNQTIATQTVTIGDFTPPVIVSGIPANATYACTDVIPSPPPLSSIIATDNCSVPADIVITYAQTTVPGSCPNSYTLHRTWTATDQCSNSSSATQVITIQDNVAPTADALPALGPFVCYASIPAANINDVTGEVDNCGGAVTVTFVSDGANPGCTGTVVRTYRLTDVCGNSATITQNITISDNIAPTADPLPALGPFTCYSNIPANNINDVTGEVDNCGGTVTVAFVSDGANPGCAGTVVRTYRLTDVCGNSAMITQNISINDNVAPTADPLPALGPFACYSNIPANNINDVTGEMDNCGGTVTVAFVSDGANPGCSGTVVRTYRLTDACGNAANITQNILIQDIVPPVITCPGNVNTVADPGKTFATISLPAPTYSDNCTPTGNISITWVMTVPTAGSGTGIIPVPFQFNLGTTTVTYSATDACGNVSSCSFTVVVASDDPPVITCPSNLMVNTDSGICSASIDPGFPVKLSGTDPIIYTWVMTGATTGSGTGPIGVYLFNLGVTTITWTATNIAGSVTCTQTITVMDSEKPRFLVLPVSVRYFCVIAIFQANFYPDTVDITPIRPDYYILTPTDKSNLDLNPATFLDNCTPAANLILHWRIDFNGGVPSPIAGTGQISNYMGELRFPGAPKIDITHTISYWLEDDFNNLSDEVVVNIIIKPRPDVVKLTH